VTWDNIVEEPILAGFAFSRFAPDIDGRVLIYDFGGGSFDAAILDIQRQGRSQTITVLATAGENWLGGDDIDAIVRRHFLSQISEQADIDIATVQARLEPLDIWRLRALAKRAKEDLTDNALFEDALLSENLGVFVLSLSRAQLDDLLIIPDAHGNTLLDRSLDAVLRACKLVHALDLSKESELLDAEGVVAHTLKAAARKLNRVVLVGGVAKMPLVRERLSQVFGANRIVSESVIEPVTAVAVGCAYPREPQHYSLAHPPFEIALRVKGQQQQLVFEPYEHYRFHDSWAWSAVPAHRSPTVTPERQPRGPPHRRKRLDLVRVT
jgi:molecular chaperone DnaK